MAAVLSSPQSQMGTSISSSMPYSTTCASSSSASGPRACSQNPYTSHGGSNQVSSRGALSTYSVPFSAGVVFERPNPIHPPRDEDIIIVTVRVSDKFQEKSLEGSKELPERPQKRSFLRRMSTRISGNDAGAHQDGRIKAIKMPRGEYKRYFARDTRGAYIGTEEEREWDWEELKREYGVYQNLPIHSILK